jgi:hypothetical protein
MLKEWWKELEIKYQNAVSASTAHGIHVLLEVGWKSAKRIQAS